jgi:hypothetical protein
MKSKKNGRMMLALLGTAAAAWAQAPQLTTIYTFAGGNDAAVPTTAVTVTKGGVLYGATEYGGTSAHGAVYRLKPPVTAGNPWTEDVLYSVRGSGSDDYHASGPVVLGPDGILYGTEILTSDYGIVEGGELYSLTPPASPGEAWTYEELYSFDGQKYGPEAIAMGPGGVLYGSSAPGSGSTQDTVFALNPPASSGAQWTESVLYSFPSGSDGFIAQPIVVDSAGAILGTLTGSNTGGGAVFALTPPTSGSSWTEDTIYTFSFSSGDAAYPGPLTLGGKGKLYGITQTGGCDGGCGTVYSLTAPSTPGEAWTETVLYSFSDTDAGAFPNSALVVGPGGVLYGTAIYGAIPYGIVYSLTPPSSPGGPWTFAILFSFSDDSNGAYPNGLSLGPGGVLYGTTTGDQVNNSGTVFELKP